MAIYCCLKSPTFTYLYDIENITGKTNDIE